ncbi:MAG: hypothetical protein EON49_21245 [Acidovorax sp.]|nr:MAG: hypothetical protein EON49_21245 [Acidovorax sp.]
MITPIDQRPARLADAGLPPGLLAAIDAAAHQPQALHSIIGPPDAAYFYLPQVIEQRPALEGWEITPIGDGSNGAAFYVALSGADTPLRYVRLTLENKDIDEDFGPHVDLLLAHLLIELYEFADDTPVEDLAQVGRNIGLTRAQSLLEALESASEDHVRSSLEGDRAWRRQVLPRILGL